MLVPLLICDDSAAELVCSEPLAQWRLSFDELLLQHPQHRCHDLQQEGAMDSAQFSVHYSLGHACSLHHAESLLVCNCGKTADLLRAVHLLPPQGCLLDEQVDEGRASDVEAVQHCPIRPGAEAPRG